jgi:hypothetical protein
MHESRPKPVIRRSTFKTGGPAVVHKDQRSLKMLRSGAPKLVPRGAERRRKKNNRERKRSPRMTGRRGRLKESERTLMRHLMFLMYEDI